MIDSQTLTPIWFTKEEIHSLRGLLIEHHLHCLASIEDNTARLADIRSAGPRPPRVSAFWAERAELHEAIIRTRQADIAKLLDLMPLLKEHA